MIACSVRPNGKFLRTFGACAIRPFITPDDNLIRSDGAHRVIKMTLEGKQLDTFGNSARTGHFFLPTHHRRQKRLGLRTEINGKRVPEIHSAKMKRSLHSADRDQRARCRSFTDITAESGSRNSSRHYTQFPQMVALR